MGDMGGGNDGADRFTIPHLSGHDMGKYLETGNRRDPNKPFAWDKVDSNLSVI